MRQSNNNIKNQITKAALAYYTLFEIKIANDNILRYVSNDNAIAFDGNTYASFPISYSQISENSNTEIETLQITVSNVSRYAQQFCENNEMRGKEIKIIIVFKDKLDIPTAKIEDKYYIDSYEVNEQAVVFTVSTKFDVLGVQLPGRLYTRTYCRWAFKGTECKYAGTEESCSKKLNRCIELDNTANFGGFPGIPAKKVYSI